MRLLRLAAVLATVLTVATNLHAQGIAPPDDAEEPAAPLTLTFEDTLALARRSSPAAVTSPALIREAAAARVEAQIYPRYNPTLEVELGPRIVDEPKSAYFSVALSQNLDLGGGVSARLKRVDAQVDAARAQGGAAVQQTLRGVALAFVRALWAERRLALAVESQTISKSILDATKKKLDAGEATALDVNVAKGGYARALADRLGAEATRDTAHGELRALLGLPHSMQLALSGRLEDPLSVDPAALAKAAKNRPDLRVLAAELEAAQADLDLAAALAAPQLSLGARYEFEDNRVHTVLGTLSVTLPIFDHAQGLSAQAEAKAGRTKVELAATEGRVDVEVATATANANKRLEAANAFEAELGTSFEDNVRLAMKGYAAGETSLSEVLLVRRELVDTETSRVDRLLELRAAEIELLYTAGMLP